MALFRPLTLGVLLLLLADSVQAASAAPVELTDEQREWLERVELLIDDEERTYFLSLQESFRRDAFIDMFWEVRDPHPETARNELRDKWSVRVDLALQLYGSLTDGRAAMLMLNGEPGRVLLPNGRPIERCFRKREELEVWFYGGSDRTSEVFIVVLFRPRFPSEAEYRVWRNDESLDPAQRFRLPTTDPSMFCDSDTWTWAMRTITEMGWDRYRNLIDEITSIPEPSSREWLATFASGTTLVPAGAARIEADLAFDFPGRNQNRVAVRGVVTIPSSALASHQAGDGGVHELLLTGEVVRQDRLFERFRYRFEIPVGGRTGRVPLVFQRYLRPGSVRVLLKVEDLLGRRFAQLDRRLEVPAAATLASLRQVPDSELFRRLEEASDAAERGQTTIRILPPPQREIMVGPLRISTVSSGAFREVTFYLDGKPVLTKRRPPFSVEVNLGEMAASHRLRVVAYDDHGQEAASDEIVINQGGQRFRVRFVEPRPDRKYEQSLSAVIRVEVPDGQELDRVELFLDEQRVATLFQSPFVQPVLLERAGMAYVRAVGYLADGNSTEDVVFINAPDYFERLDIQFVELYATVVGRDGNPVIDLGEPSFTVREDGEEQQIRRFEYVRDLPIHAAFLIDTSASMEESLPQVAEAARAFAEQAIQPPDRATLIAFDTRPRVEARFTNDVAELAAALAALRSGGSTAIYDNLVFALHYFDGVKGPKALLLLSDGKDEESHFDFEGALAVAHRIGVTVYVIGLRDLARDRAARRLLRRIARETGGRSFFIEDLGELGSIYQAIQDDLRSQYLIAYQSTSAKNPDQLRRIEVEVDQPGAEVRTLSGYYP